MRPITIALLALVGCAIVLGLTLGRKMSMLSETDVIEHFALRYVQKTGGERTDCHAVPSPLPEVWMIVECGQGTKQMRYAVNRQGVEIPPPLAPDA